MAELNLTVMTPDKQAFSGPVKSFIIRTMQGDIGIMKNHVKYVTAVAIGRMKITTDEGTRIAAVSKGFLTTDGNNATVLVDSFEWKEEIDVERAKVAETKARTMIEKHDANLALAELKLKRALNRINVKNSMV